VCVCVCVCVSNSLVATRNRAAKFRFTIPNQISFCRKMTFLSEEYAY